MRYVLWIALVMSGCGTLKGGEARPLDPDTVRDGEVRPRAVKRPDGPGKEALREWAGRCYEQAAAYSAVFRRGGHLVIRWVADRNGDLLQMEFAEDTFRGWAIGPTGQTLADCVIGLARADREVIWSAQGVAPLRFHPPAVPGGSAPASAPSIIDSAEPPHHPGRP